MFCPHAGSSIMQYTHSHIQAVDRFQIFAGKMQFQVFVFIMRSQQTATSQIEVCWGTKITAPKCPGNLPHLEFIWLIVNHVVDHRRYVQSWRTDWPPAHVATTFHRSHSHVLCCFAQLSVYVFFSKQKRLHRQSNCYSSKPSQLRGWLHLVPHPHWPRDGIFHQARHRDRRGFPGPKVRGKIFRQLLKISKRLNRKATRSWNFWDIVGVTQHWAFWQIFVGMH